MAYYTDREGAKRVARIVEVHYDDQPPYYTIAVGEQERHTTREKLAPIGEAARKPQWPPPPSLPAVPPPPQLSTESDDEDVNFAD